MPMAGIIGINAYHADASAAFVADGKLIAAADIVEAAFEDEGMTLPVRPVDVDIIQNQPVGPATVSPAVRENSGLLRAADIQQHTAEVHAVHSVYLRNQEHGVGGA